VAPFLRGHHPTTTSAMTYADGITLAADAAAVAQALDPEGVDMIGHDIGAGMVGRVAAAWPERVRAAVTMAIPAPAALPPILADPEQQKRLFYVWLFQLDIAEAMFTPDLIEYLWRTWSPSLDAKEHVETAKQLYADEDIKANALKLYRGNFDPRLHDPALTGLAAKTEAPASIPMLVLAGDEDGCIPADKFSHEGLAPGSRVDVVTGAGHFIHLDRPDEVARKALDWFREPSAGTPASG